MTLNKINSQALGLQRKIQKQRHSGSNLPFLPVLLCTTSYLIILSVRSRKDDKSVEKHTGVGVHCRHPMVAPSGAEPDLSGGPVQFRRLGPLHGWVREATVSSLPCPLMPILGNLGNSHNSLGSCHELGQWRKSVLLSILVDCRIQVFLAFLSVLQNPLIKARQSLVFCGWNRQNIKNPKWTGRISYLIRGDSL